VLGAIEEVIELHAAIDEAGFVSIDLYDGNMLYDDRIHMIDVDEYRPSPHVLDADRTLGSTRFMAPEESRRGATLDSRTTVFQLGAHGGFQTVADLLAAWRRVRSC
jgi:serine/threonine-protein kinase